jgi:hypothetical protein
MTRFFEGLEFYKDTLYESTGKKECLILENTITKLEKYTNK